MVLFPDPNNPRARESLPVSPAGNTGSDLHWGCLGIGTRIIALHSCLCPPRPPLYWWCCGGEHSLHTVLHGQHTRKGISDMATEQVVNHNFKCNPVRTCDLAALVLSISTSQQLKGPKLTRTRHANITNSLDYEYS